MTRISRAAVALALSLTAVTAVCFAEDPITDEVRQIRETQVREQVAKNLEQVGKAILQYQQQYNQTYPRTIVPIVPTTAATTAPATTRPAADVGPEATLRMFLIAMAKGDADGLSEVAVHRDGIEVLTTRPAANNPVELEKVLDQMRSMPLKRLKAGDPVTIAVGGENRTFEVDVTQANDGLALVQMGGNTPPILLVRLDGKWLVDPRPLIAARQAAQKVRDRHGRATSRP